MIRTHGLRLLVLGLILQAVLVANLLRGHNGSAQQCLYASDGAHYAFVARLAVTGTRHADMPEWADRMFIGWPLTFALPGTLFDFESMCILFASLFAAFTPVIVWRMTGDWVVSLASALISPTWLQQSSMGMGEPAFLVYQLVAIWACLAGRTTIGSLAAAAAMTVRPNAAIVWLALAFILGRRRDWSALAVHAAIAGTAAMAVVAFNVHFYGEPLRQLHLYNQLPNVSDEAKAAIGALTHDTSGHMGWPLVNQLATPFLLPVPIWKTVYIWLHLAAVFVASRLGIRELRVRGFLSAPAAQAPERETRRDELQTVMVIWAVLNTCFVVCTGPYWGFFTFDRFCLWAMPAYLYLARHYLPKRPLVWAGIGSLSLALALYNQTRYFIHPG
jgi:hypothetical protein